jgi:hypothetical protein
MLLLGILFAACLLLFLLLVLTQPLSHAKEDPDSPPQEVSLASVKVDRPKPQGRVLVVTGTGKPNERKASSFTNCV